MSTPTYAPETPAADTVAPDAHIPDGTDFSSRSFARSSPTSSGTRSKS